MALICMGCDQELCVVVTHPKFERQSFARLGDALGAAAPGATLSLCPSLPAESVVIDRPVEIRGGPEVVITGTKGAPTMLVRGIPGTEVRLRDVAIVAPDEGDHAAVVVRGQVTLKGERVTISAGGDPQDAGDLRRDPADSGTLTPDAGESDDAERSTTDRALLLGRYGATVRLHQSRLHSARSSAVSMTDSTLFLEEVDVADTGADSIVVAGGLATLSDVRIVDAGGAALRADNTQLTLSDIHIDGGQTGIEAVGGTLSFQNSLIERARTVGIDVSAGSSALDGIEIRDSGGGCMAVLGGTLDAADVALSGCVGHGVDLTAAAGHLDHVSIRSGAEAMGITEIGLSSIDAEVELSDVTIDDARTGIAVVGGSLKADGVSLSGLYRAGLTVSGGYTYCARCVISGGIDGIRATDSAALAVEDSTITDAVAAGLSLLDRSTTVVSGTDIDACSTGIRLADADTSLNANAIVVSNAERDGIELRDGTLFLLDSRVETSSLSGLSATGGVLVVAGATFEDNRLNGVDLSGDVTASVTAVLNRNDGYGLYCDGDAADTSRSSVALGICNVGGEENGNGGPEFLYRLVNGCQQDQYCTVTK